MAIKRVKVIPKPVHTINRGPSDYTVNLKKDLQKAWDKRYNKFEFTGYENNTYVVANARQIAYNMVKGFIQVGYRDATVKLQDALRPILGKCVECIKLLPPYNTAEPIIKVHGVTVDGVKRAFCEIDWDLIDNYPDKVAEMYKDRYLSEKGRQELAKQYAERLAKKARERRRK